LARLGVLAFAMAMVSAAPAEAETGADFDAGALASTIRFSAEGPLQVERRRFSFPIVEYTDPTGRRQQRKGIIASKMLTPDTMVGIGLFETTPKTRGYWGDVPNTIAPKQPRRAAAVGLNWRF